MKVGEAGVGCAGDGGLGLSEPAPFGDGEGADVFGGAGEVGGDAEPGGGAAGDEDGFE